jgi:hypothetical protein
MTLDLSGYSRLRIEVSWGSDREATSERKPLIWGLRKMSASSSLLEVGSGGRTDLVRGATGGFCDTLTVARRVVVVEARWSPGTSADVLPEFLLGDEK